MNWTERRERLRAIVEGKRCIFPASVYDGISARIAADVGFEAMMFAGSVCSFSVIAAPDLCVLTLTEFAQQAYRINRAGSLPLCVDADHGYGNALSVKRTVEELEECGRLGADHRGHAAAGAVRRRRRAARSRSKRASARCAPRLAGRQDPRLVICGRTSAIAITGVEDTIARLKAYEAAGVDLLFVAGLKNREQLDALSSALKKPLFLGNVPEDMMDADYLSARNVRVCLQGHHQFWAGVQGVYNTLKALRDGTKPSKLPNVASADLQKKLLRQADYSRSGPKTSSTPSSFLNTR